MSNLTVLVFFVTIFVIAHHGLAVRNFTTTDSIGKKDESNEITIIPHHFTHTETKVDDKENIRFPRHTNIIIHTRRNPSNITDFIINGIPARKDQFPYQVAVYRKSDMKFLSNAAIISAHYVLTDAWYICKAHGAKEISPQDLVVHAGMVSLSATDLQSYAVEDTVCPEKYNPPMNVMHELALIQITNSSEFNPNARLKMPTRSYDSYLPVRISGWGWTKQRDGEVNEYLRYGHTVTLSLEECRQKLQDNTDWFLSAATGCTRRFGPSGGPNAWLYEGGAPVVHRDQLVGIGVRFYPGAHAEGYVSVWHHIDWIKQTVKCLN